MGRNTLKIYHHSESFLHSILGCNTHVGQIVDFGYAGAISKSRNFPG